MSNSKKQESRLLNIIKYILINNNSTKEENTETPNYVYDDIMQDKKIVSSNPFIKLTPNKYNKEEYYISEILLAIFKKMYEHGYYEISLRNEDVEEYVTKIKKLLKELNISNDIFDIEPRERACSAFKNLIIKRAYERDFGYYDDETKTLILNMHYIVTDKKLENDRKMSKIVERGYLIITSVQDNNKINGNKEKKHSLSPKKRSIKPIDFTGSIC